MIPHRTIFSGFRIRNSERQDFRSERSDLRSERPDLRSERSDLRSERPDLRSERPDLRSERSDLRSERVLKGGTYGRTETGENRPVWNHRSSAPPGPLPKKRREGKRRRLRKDMIS